MLMNTLFTALLSVGYATAQASNEVARARYLFPASRGSNSLVTTVAPCQGFELGGRMEYPISGGVVSWATLVDIKNVQIRYTTTANPTSQSDFQNVITNVTGGWRGTQCIDGPDFSALGLSEGDQVTMQFYWTAGPSNTEQYECADLTLISEQAFAAANYDTQCTNLVETTKQRRDSVSNPTLTTLQAEASASAAAESQSETGGESSDNGLTNAEAGVIGAMVTLAVCVIAILMGYFGGLVVFGNRAKHARAHSGHNMETKSVSSA